MQKTQQAFLKHESPLMELGDKSCARTSCDCLSFSLRVYVCVRVCFSTTHTGKRSTSSEFVPTSPFRGDLMYLVHRCHMNGGKEPLTSRQTHTHTRLRFANLKTNITREIQKKEKKAFLSCAWRVCGTGGQKKGPGRCIMRKYHLSALNLFWGLSPLSSLCSGRLCDNTNAETQTGNNSSPNGGPSDLGLPL